MCVEAGVTILDVSNPEAAQVIGTYSPPFFGGFNPDRTVDFAVSGRYGFLPRPFSGMVVLDLSNPTKPRSIIEIDMNGYVGGVAASGNFVYAAAGGLTVVSLSDPVQPIVFQAFSVAGYLRRLRLAGSHAFLASSHSYNSTDGQGLVIADISTPSAPKRLGKYVGSGAAYDVAISENLAYVADFENGLEIVDFLNPNSPTLVAGYPTAQAQCVAIHDNVVFLGHGSGFHILDVSDPAQPIKIGSYLGGAPVRSLAVSGNRLYVADSAFKIFDITNPAAPQRVDMNTFSGTGQGLAIDGNVACLADGVGGLRIFDTSVPADVRLVSRPPVAGVARDVKMLGNIAYVAVSGASSGGLLIVDISNPATPKWLGFSGTAVNASRLAVSWPYIWVADRDELGQKGQGVFVVDVSDPTHPGIVRQFNTSGLCEDIAVFAGHAYVANGNAGMQILPKIDEIAWPVGLPTPGPVHSLALTGNYAFLAGPQVQSLDNDLALVDISDPGSPRLIKGYYSAGGEARLIGIFGDIGGVAGSAAAQGIGVQLFNMVNPPDPKWLGGYPSALDVRAFAITNNMLYVANESGLKAVQIRIGTPQALQFVLPTQVHMRDSPITLSAVSSAGLPVTFSVVSGPGTIVGNQLFTTAPGRVTVRAEQGGNDTFLPVAQDRSVLFFDGPVPQFTPIGSWPGYARGPALDVKSVDNIAYVASGAGGLVIWDISDPAKPIHLGGIDTLGTVSHVVLEGNYAYIVDSEEGFIAIDISDPSRPLRAGNYRTAGSAAVLDVSGNYAYVGCRATRANSDVPSEGFLVLDITEPRFPKPVQNISFPTNAYYPLYLYRLVVTNNLAYVSAWMGGSLLLTYDVSNPPAPKQIVGNGSIPPSPTFTTPDVGGYTTDVEVSDGYAYLADGNLQVIDVSDPANPRWISSHEPASSISISGNIACTVYRNTFRVIDISDKKNLKTIATNTLFVGGLSSAGYYQVLISGSHAFARGYVYVDDLGGPTIHVYDISNPAAPRVVNNLYWLGATGNIAVENERLYSGGNGSLVITDLTDPAHEVVLSRPPADYMSSITVRGNYVFGTAANGFQIMDVTDPKHAFSVGECQIPSTGSNIRLFGSCAYISGGSDIHVVDISDVTKPTWIGSYHDEGEPFDVVVVGKDLFIADGSAGLHVVSERFGSPQKITFDAPKQIAVGESFTLTATADSGLPVSFSVISGPATIEGGSLRIIGSGEVRVRAEQKGNDTILATFFEAKINSPPAPNLQIRSSAFGIEFVWNGNDAATKLEKSTALGLNDWQDVNAPVERSASQTAVKLPATNQTRFYRLRRD